MTTTWKQAQKEYRQKLSERYGVSLRESLDIDAFKRNPRKYFDENGWVIPKEDFEDIAVALAELANSDSEISVEDVELGKKGEYVQGIVQKLMTTDKMFAKVMDKVGNHMTEGKGKAVAIALTCLALLVGAGAIADGVNNASSNRHPITYEEYQKANSSSVSTSSMSYEDYNKNAKISGWSAFHFVDDFGDETDNVGIKLTAIDSSRSTDYSTIKYSIIIEEYSSVNNLPYLISFNINRELYGDILIKIKKDGEVKQYNGRYSESAKRIYLKDNKDNNEVIDLMKGTCHIIIVSSTNRTYDFGYIGIGDDDLSKVSAVKINNEKDNSQEESNSVTSIRQLPVKVKNELNSAYYSMSLGGSVSLEDFYSLVRKYCGEDFPIEKINEYYGIE